MRAEGNSTFLMRPIHHPVISGSQKVESPDVGPPCAILNKMGNLEVAKHLEGFTSSSHFAMSLSFCNIS